jgi:hypothetical protein
MNNFKVGDIIGYYPDNPLKFCVIQKIELNSGSNDKLWGLWCDSIEEAIKNKHLSNSLGFTKTYGYMHAKDIILIKKSSKPAITPFGISKFVDEINRGKYIK